MKYYTFIILLILCSNSVWGQTDSRDTVNCNPASVRFERQVKPKAGFAALELVGLDAIFWGASKFVAGKPFADISLATIKKNLDTGFVWDNDEFPTNLVAHPYQGGLYFSAGRAWGLSFLQSIPYAFTGSFIWEMFLENEPASINDLITTTIGGMAYGEVMHRCSDRFVCYDQRGVKRLGKELIAAVIDPAKAVKRLSTGELWAYDPGYQRIDVKEELRIQAGARYIGNQRGTGEWNPIISLKYTYNDPFDVSGRTPFEYFELDGMFNMGDHQPLLGEIRITGLLFGETIKPNWLIGGFQQYNYMNSERVSNSVNKQEIPFRIAETAAFGVGSIWEKEIVRNVNVRSDLYLTGVLLGSYYSDYYRFGKRDYTYGSGFSYRANIKFDLWTNVSLFAQTEGIELFNPQSYRWSDTVNKNQLYLNIQGDRGRSYVTKQQASVAVDLWKGLGLSLIYSHYNRFVKEFNPYNSRIISYNFSNQDIRLQLSYTFH